ncbi:MAG: hypothetical protein RBR14_06440 [Candidatus Cloacimonas acidaminovorans]|nr:hypothetical protein [Candidatus Cloacimonas acidaminovorans]
MKKKMKPERVFEKEFAWCCKIKKCLYIKIPDPIMTEKRVQMMRDRGVSDELKRPFDGILVKKTGNYCLEFKFGYGKLSEHQKYYQETINGINQSFYIVRKTVTKVRNEIAKKIIYKLTLPDGQILQSNNLEDIIDYIGGNND